MVFSRSLSAAFRSDKESPRINILKPLLHGSKTILSFSLHSSPVRLLAHVGNSSICFSADKDGGLELWDVQTGRRANKDTHPKEIGFEFKADTHLFDLQRVSPRVADGWCLHFRAVSTVPSDFDRF